MKRYVERTKKFFKTLNKEHLSYSILFLMIFVYSFVMIVTTINYHNRFWFSAFDIGIFDQGIWLLSQGENPFVTVRGLHIFGDHVQFIILLLVPFYWIWNNIRMLLIIQSVALGLGAVPIYLLSKEKFQNQLIPLVFVFSYLTYPALHFLNLENFHPVSLAIPILLSGFYFLTKKSYPIYFLFIFLALITRQELALTTLVIGIFAFFKYDRKIGILTILASVLWLFLVFNVFFPYYSPFGNTNIESRGGDIVKITKEMITSPVKILDLNTEQNREYIWNLFFPVVFLSLLHLPTLFLVSPAIGINLLTTWPYAHSIEYHYTYAIIPFVFISMIYGVKFLDDFLEKKETKNRKKIFVLILSLIVIFAIIGNINIGPEVTSLKNYKQIYQKIGTFNKILPGEEPKYEAIKLVPENASVSASYLLVPHLSHRKIIYMFPNPFKESYWGAEFGNYTPPTPTKDADYIIVDSTISDSEKDMIDDFLEKGIYQQIFDDQDITVFKRNKNVAL